MTAAALDDVDEAIYVVDARTDSGRFTDVNRAACRMLGYPREELLGLGLTEVDVGVLRDAPDGWRSIIDAADGGDGVRRLETVHRRRDGSGLPVVLAVRHLTGSHPALLVIARDQREAALADRQRLAHAAITEALGESRSPDDLGERVLAGIAGIPGADVREVWLVDGDRIRPAATWSSPHVDPVAVAGVVPRKPLRRGAGLPGKVWSRRQRVVVADLAGARRPRGVVGAAAGLRSAVGLPLLDGPRVVGALLLYSRDGVDMSDAVAASAEVFGAHLGQAIGRLQAQDAHERFEASFRLLFASNPMPMWLYDEQTLRFLAVNDAAVAHYGYSQEEFLARTILDIRPAEDVPALEADVAARRGTYRQRSRWRHLRRDGQVIDVEITSHRVEVGARRAVLVTALDVTERVALTAQVERHARRDQLTGLGNRTSFLDDLGSALAGGRAAAATVVVLDIDHLRSLNLRLGHSLTDRLLAVTAGRLDQALRRDPRCGPMARLGADQFGCLVEGATAPAEVDGIVDRLLATLDDGILVGDEMVRLTACVGIAATDDEDADADVLVAEAEAALERAKSRGPGQRELSTQTARAELEQRLELGRALSGAADRGEMTLAYQPKFALVDERIVGVEALLRWERPGRGWVSPLDFLPTAERTGDIMRIGSWVMEQACRDVARWQAAFPGRAPLVVSVNVSPRQFDADLVAVVQSAAAAAGIRPDGLCLEVTESTIMADVDSAAATLRALKALGVRVSIDDFGTGYSSLAYLRRLPLDELKIDRSFVDGLDRDDESMAIVAAITATAHALGLTVVAEGVERVEQLERLRILGCDELQGYLLARPAPAARIDELLAAEATGVVAARARRGAASREGQGSESVLVVDDAPTVRELVRMTLTAAGFAVHEAATGISAVLLAGSVRPDCVVLDVNLPDLSGHEVCRMFRQDSAFDDVAIVMLTSEGASREKVAAFARDADDYIVKPFTPRDLVDRVRLAMHRRRGAATRGAAR